MSINLIDRVQKILTAPNAEWDVIAGETGNVQEIATMYVAPLVAAQQLVAMLGLMIFAHYPLESALVQVVVGILLNFGIVFALAAIIDGLAENFGAKKDFAQSFKVAAYAPTPLWVFGLISFIPQLAMVGLLLGLYALYQLFIGLPKVKKPKKDQEAVYALAAIGAIVILSLVVVVVLRQLVATAQGY